MSYFFSTPLDIDIRLNDADDKRQMVDIKLDKNRKEKCPLYMDGETVKGAVTIRPKDGKRLEHTGIKVQFIGTIGRRTSNPNPPSSWVATWIRVICC
jgi:vacuolar protein sorting-associated protein 26